MKALKEYNVIKVTAADFNGKSFDGLPLEPLTEWVKEKEDKGEIRVVNPDSDLWPGPTDYAVWEVDTLSGKTLAWPGDLIVLDQFNNLAVVKKEQEGS